MNSERFEDTGIIHFDHEDILITDPCYIVKKNNGNNDQDDDWGKCNFGTNFEVFGFKNNRYLTHDTIIGDWSWDLINSNNNRLIGSFCADSGQVSIFTLKDVLEHNKDYDYNDEVKHGCAAIVKDFVGSVCIKVVEEEEKYFDENVDEFDENYSSKRRNFKVARVIGKGNINFHSEIQ